MLDIVALHTQMQVGVATTQPPSWLQPAATRQPLTAGGCWQEPASTWLRP